MELADAKRLKELEKEMLAESTDGRSCGFDGWKALECVPNPNGHRDKG